MASAATDILAASANPWRLAEGQDEGSMWLAWLVRLRWVAIVGQIVTLSFTFAVLEHPVLILPLLLGAVGVLVAANTMAIRRLNDEAPVGPDLLLGHLMLDVGVLTGFFLVSGGAENPFVMLYLIHVAMAAVMMRPRHAVLLMAFVVVANAVLHLVRLPLRLENHPLPAPVLESMGQMVAFGVTVASVGLFVLGMASTLRRQKERLIEVRERTAQTDRLRAVGTLAAGAAHELNTPLSTMGLRLRRVGRRHDDEATQQDVAVVQGQLDRCRDIVQQLLLGAGDPSAAGFERATLQDFVAQALKLWSKGASIEVRVQLDEDPVAVELPRAAFTQALINLVENAREAQAEVGVTAPLLVRVDREIGRGIVTIHDHGPGLPPEPDRVGEPFFTTKPTGTGLGVFVARALANGAGGDLSYARDGDVTIARWTFPETERIP